MEVQASSRGSRRWLTVAHGVWGLLTVFDLVMFAFSIAPTFTIFLKPCSAPNADDCLPGQIARVDWIAMQANGITPSAYAAFALTIIILVSLLMFAVGFLIAWRKWGDLMGLFVSATLITFGSTGISDALTNGHSSGLLATIFGLAQFVIVVLSYPALATFMLTFPTGKFAPRWTWLIVLLWIIQFGLFNFGLPPFVLVISVITTWGSCAVVQVYRYRSVYTPTQRQQTKWVVFTLAVVIPLQGVASALPSLFPELNIPGSWYRLAGIIILALFWAPIWLSVGIAILRSRLYDIDLLINRSLVYGLLTAILAGLYAGGVFGGQRLIATIAGPSASAQESPLTIVLTTLLVAALFQPLRRRLQVTIDRRFFRSKYNAARAIATFSATLRSEVNLPDLTDHMLDLVDEAMQPAHVSLWLLPHERERHDTHLLPPDERERPYAGGGPDLPR